MDRIMSGNRVLDEEEGIRRYFDKINRDIARKQNYYNDKMVKAGKLCGKCVHFDRDKTRNYPDNAKRRYCLLHITKPARRLLSPGCDDFDIHQDS